MHTKPLLSLLMLSVGVTLLVAASMVGVASAKTGSTGHLIVTQAGTGFDTLDPQLSYVSNDWGLLYNTEITLLNFPTKAGINGTKLIPQAAKAFPTITNHGKTYVFNIRPGLKLSNGEAITAQNFVRSFERNLSPKMYAAYGIADGLDQFLVGGKKFAAGKAPHISGLTAKKLTLTIKLTKVVPQFATIMGMPWFMAVPKKMPYNNTPGGILKYASGGPYYISSNNLTTLTVLKRNKHWPTTRYFTSNWPSNPAAIIVKSNANSNGTPELLQAQRGQVDIALVASQDVVPVKNKYGVNRKNGQFHVGPTTCINWNAMNNQPDTNTSTALPNVRKALNYAISRVVENHFFGTLSGKGSEQILVPSIPGYKKITYYGGTGNLTAAKKVGGSSLAGARLNIYYRTSSPAQTNTAEYIQSQASRLKMDTHLQPSDPSGYYKPLMTRSIAHGPDGYNIAVGGGWCADYRDGYDYFNVNFDGRTLADTGNTNYMYFNNATFNKHMDAAAAKTGTARATAYGNLDKEFMQKYAPVIPTQISNTRTFTSARSHNIIYSIWWGQVYWNAIKLG